MEKIKILIGVLKEEIVNCDKLKACAKEMGTDKTYFAYIGKMNGLSVAVEVLEEMLTGNDVNLGEGVDQIKGKLEGLRKEILTLRSQEPFTQEGIVFFLTRMSEKIEAIIEDEIEKCVFCEKESKLFDVWLNNSKKRICGKCWGKI